MREERSMNLLLLVVNVLFTTQDNMFFQHGHMPMLLLWLCGFRHGLLAFVLTILHVIQYADA